MSRDQLLTLIGDLPPDLLLVTFHIVVLQRTIHETAERLQLTATEVLRRYELAWPLLK